jgi:GNAT superfamily N-acetyltransferase
MEQYRMLHRHPGWKYEYWDGQVHITPRHLVAVAHVEVSPRQVDATVNLREVTRADEADLIAAFLDAFSGSVDYCDWPQPRIEENAVENIRGFFEERYGKPHHASRLADADWDGLSAVLGAVLITSCKNGPRLQILFVRPGWQRRGLATALVSCALNALPGSGARRLTSSYNLANEASLRWHSRFGFVEQPDLLIARVRLQCALHELRRREGDLDDEESARLEAESTRFSAQVSALEEIAEREGFDAVAPLLRHPC